MVFKGNDVFLISDHERMQSQEQNPESFDTHVGDVQSTVAHQYALMEQDHDRIRTRELAAHRRESSVN